MTEYILAPVGDRRRAIPMDTFLEVHEELADLFRAQGLRSRELDEAIVEALPRRLVEVLGC